MGVLRALGLARDAERLRTGGADELTKAALYLLESGTAYGDVAAAGALGAFDIDAGTDYVDRATAMTIPAMRRARQVICGTIGVLPLLAHRLDPDGVTRDVTAQRPLLSQPSPYTTRAYQMTWTVDDLLFHGIAWWQVIRRDAEGYPTQAVRIRPDRVRVDLDRGQVYVDGNPIKDEDLIRFDGPDEGLLTYGGRTLRTCILLEQAVRKYARLDVPLGSLQLQEGAPELSGEAGSAGDGTQRSEIDALLDSWEEARRNRTTAYLNRAIAYTPHQFDAEKVQLAEGRQYQAAEVARLANLAPRYVNAPNASGMTYSNVADERRDLVDTSLVGYLASVADRLSMGDVTPRGTTVHFDLAGLLRGDLKTALEAAQLAVALQAMTPDEVRTDVLGRPALAPATTEGNGA